MNKKGFAPIIIYLIILAAIAVIGVGALLLYSSTIPKAGKPPVNQSVACTQEAKLCPDGSYVSRTGPNCQFAACPQPKGGCSSDSQCLAGQVCHLGACVNPVAAVCSGASDTSCGPGYQCVQDCGPPVAMANEPPPPYHCVVDEVASKPRMCPICLASNVMIDTPDGEVPVSLVSEGAKVWSVDESGNKIVSTVKQVIKFPAPKTHKVAHIILADEREIWVSLNHPLTDGRIVGDLKVGDEYDGSKVDIYEVIPYWDSYTYDLLPDSPTGFYWGNKIVLASTLKK